MPTNPVPGVLATCILRWIYEQVAAILEMLKAILLALIAYIDTQIAWLRALLAMMDVLSLAEQAAWAVFQALVEEIRNQLTNIPEGPLKELCPEFYQMFTDPASQLFEMTVAAVTVWRERYKNIVSYMDEVDELLQYWETMKQSLVYTIDVLDDAILAAMMREAAKATS
jgi:hypothetical protein